MHSVGRAHAKIVDRYPCWITELPHLPLSARTKVIFGPHGRVQPR
jgi:hypothetical protein